MLKIQIVIRVTMATVLTAAGVGLAEDHAATRKSMDPLEIMEDCIEAAKERDFGRYVDHLSPRELQVQAGYALVATSIAAPAIDAGVGVQDPETHLLVRALKDLVQRHSPSDDPWDEKRQAAEQARQQLTSQVLSAAFVQSGTYGGGNPQPQFNTREGFIKSAGALKDTRQFLIAVLDELSRPTIVSGAEPTQPVNSTKCIDVIEEYTALQWTLYTRGDYALAVAAAPKPQTPQTPCPNSECVGVCAYTNESPPTIEFRKIDGHWKIDRLLPSSVMSPTTPTSPSALTPATFDPYSTCPTPGVRPATSQAYPPNALVPPPATGTSQPR